jgi:NADH-quinone oxidoreductase subunit K
MLHGVSLTLVTFGRMYHSIEGQAFTIFILTVAACEAGLALAIVLTLYQRRKTLDVSVWSSLGEAPPPKIKEPEIVPESVLEPEQEYPVLTPAGRVPQVPKQETVGRA